MSQGGIFEGKIDSHFPLSSLSPLFSLSFPRFLSFLLLSQRIPSSLYHLSQMDPWVENQERKEMKKMKKHFDMLQFICDAEHGIPTSCPCGGRIVDEVSTNPTDKDFLPGRRYFTCNEYKVIYIFSTSLTYAKCQTECNHVKLAE